MPDGEDFRDVFDRDNIKLIVFVVALNIFLSYGFLYLSDYILALFPTLEFLPTDILFNSIGGLSLIGTVIVSPISEELIFRGVFLNRLKLIVPSVFAVLISSLIFASLHGFGSIISAFIFGMSMAVVYIKTDNILVAVFAHFLNNLVAEIIVFFDSSNILFTNPDIVWVMSALAVVSFVMIFIFIVRELNNLKYE